MPDPKLTKSQLADWTAACNATTAATQSVDAAIAESMRVEQRAQQQVQQARQAIAQAEQRQAQAVTKLRELGLYFGGIHGVERDAIDGGRLDIAEDTGEITVREEPQ